MHCLSHWSPPYCHRHRYNNCNVSLSLGLPHRTSSDFLSFTQTSIGLVKISLWTSLFTYPFIESFLGRTHLLPLTPYCLGTSGITLLATFRLFIFFTPFHGRGHSLCVSMRQHCAWLIVPMGVAEAAVGELHPDGGGSGQHACLMGSC